MKRIISILLVVMMVFSMTGCDPETRGNLANMMGAMGQNVMGSDTSAVNKIEEQAKVDTSKIKDETQIKGESDGKDTPITIAPGLEVKVPDTEAEKIKSVLPAMEEQQKNDILDTVGSALQNKESTDALVEKMKQPYEDEAVVTAAQGTATVMKSALKQVAESLPEEVPQEMKDKIGNLGKSLEKISEDPTGITKADVVTLGLVQSFVETVNENANDIKMGNVPDAVLSDANNLVTVASALSEASKFDPLAIDYSHYIPSGSIAGTKSMTRAAEAEPVADGESAKEALEALRDLEVDSDIQQYINLANKIVTDIVGADNSNFAATKSGLGFHKMSYENYANMVAMKLNLSITVTEKDKADHTATVTHDEENPFKNSIEFKEFKTFSGLMQYAAAAVLSEGDDYYLAFKKELNAEWNLSKDAWADQYVNSLENFEKMTDEEKAAAKKKYISDVSAALAKLPGDINTLIVQIRNANAWVVEPEAEKVKFKVPEAYEALQDLPLKEIGEISLYTMTGRDKDGNLDPGKRQFFRDIMDTLNVMVVFTDLSNLGAVGNMDLNYYLTTSIQSLYVDAITEDETV